MAAKRLVRKFTEVVAEVERQLKAHYNVTQKELDAWRARARASEYLFPHSTMVAIEDLWIDYEVQRDVIHKHVINIMRKWDARICSPGSACRVNGSNIYFASYAFEMLNDTGVKRLTPGDLHRNALVRYKNGSRDIKVVRAKTMQDQFDVTGIDLQDKGSRASDNLRGDNDYYFSHFKYAQKGIEIDDSGKILLNMLSAIKDTFAMQEEIDQGVYIGLYELHRISGTSANTKLPAGWMKSVLETIKSTFKSSSLIHAKGKVQWEHVNPGSTWSAPSAMANFLRELYLRNGGTINLPYHGEGAKMGIEAGNIAPGLFPEDSK